MDEHEDIQQLECHRRCDEEVTGNDASAWQPPFLFMLVAASRSAAPLKIRRPSQDSYTGRGNDRVNDAHIVEECKGFYSLDSSVLCAVHCTL
jgi:hypothetical protein